MTAFVRNRRTPAALAALTIPLGLLSRSVPALPLICAKAAGDALYATLVYWLVLLVAPALSMRRAAWTAIGVCFAVELSQLYQAPWIVAIRETRLGGLVLGHGFHFADLAYYVVGATLGVVVDRALRATRFG